MYNGHLNSIFLYVHELLITGSTVSSILVIKIALHNAFEMSNLGFLKQFLGLKIEKNYDGIMVTKSKYVSYLLFKFNMAKCRVVDSWK